MQIQMVTLNLPKTRHSPDMESLAKNRPAPTPPQPALALFFFLTCGAYDVFALGFFPVASRLPPLLIVGLAIIASTINSPMATSIPDLRLVPSSPVDCCSQARRCSWRL